MQRIRCFALAAATIALSVVVAAARAHEGHHHNAMGTIRAVQANQLDLETTEGKIEVFVLTDTTSYKRGDAAAKKEDLVVGARAAVMYEAKGGKNLAIEIKLGTAGHEGHGSRSGRASSGGGHHLQTRLQCASPGRAEIRVHGQQLPPRRAPDSS
jgi:hypothetical protein